MVEEQKPKVTTWDDSFEEDDEEEFGAANVPNQES